MYKIFAKDDSVDLLGLNVMMKPVLETVSKCFFDYGIRCVVTAGKENGHSVGSYHRYGFAVDFRTKALTAVEKRGLTVTTRRRLRNYPFGDCYDVVLHETHLHVEFDVFRFLNAMFVSTRKEPGK